MLKRSPYLVALAALASFACPAAAAPTGASKIDIRLDPRIELSGVVLLLSTAPPPAGFANHRIPYTEKVLDRFASLRGHAAARLEASSALARFALSDRAQVLVRLSPLPELKKALVIPYALGAQAGGGENLDSWISALRDFARDSRFLESFPILSQILEPEVERFRSQAARLDYLAKIEAYAGLPLLGRHEILLSPFHSPGGVANNVDLLEDGSVAIASVMGPESTGSGIDFWTRRVPGVLWHEAGHGILDPLSTLYSKAVAHSSAAHSRMGWACYGSWNQCVREHVVRAVMLRLLALELGPAAQEEQWRWEEAEKKYPFLKAMLQRLELYERSRERYPTLADFYPELLEPLGAAAPRPEPSPSCLTQEPDGPARRRISRFLEMVRSRAKDPALQAFAAGAAAWSPPPPLLPESPAPPGPLPSSAETDKKEGIRRYLAGDPESAARHLEAALAADPGDLESLLSLAVVLQALRRHEEALSRYDRLLELVVARKAQDCSRILADALESRSSLWLSLDRRERALADIGRALSVAPADWPRRLEAESRRQGLEGQ